MKKVTNKFNQYSVITLSICLSVFLLKDIIPSPVYASVNAHEYIDMKNKAANYLSQIQVHHLIDNQIVIARTPSGEAEEIGDSATYTGYYIASESFRYRTTGAADAYTNVENGLKALHKMQEVSGTPGIVARFAYTDGTPWLNSKTFTSKDVYTGVMFAYSVAFPILKDGDVKNMVKQDVQNIGNNFLANNYAFVGAHDAFVDLKPGFDIQYLEYIADINPQQVIDFVDQLKNVRKEFNKPYAAFTLAWLASGPQRCDTSSVYYNESLCSVPTGMTRDQVIASGRFLQSIYDALQSLGWEDPVDYSKFPADRVKMDQFFDALFTDNWLQNPAAPCIPSVCISVHANYIVSVFKSNWTEGFTLFINKLLPVIKTIPVGLSATIKEIKASFSTESAFYSWLGGQGMDSYWVEFIKSWFVNENALNTAFSKYTDKIPNSVSKPEDIMVVSTNALLTLHTLKVAFQVTGDSKFINHYNSLGGSYTGVAKSFGVAGDELTTIIFGDASADALREGGTHQLEWVALYDLLSLETDPYLKASYQQILNDSFSYISDEGNSFANFIQVLYSNTPSQQAKIDAITSLKLFPSYGSGDFDYTCDMPIVQNEFGGCVTFQGHTVTRNPIPLDKRPRDASTWQRSPRRLTNGNNYTFAGADYLLAYWMGMYHGLILDKDLTINNQSLSDILYLISQNSIKLQGSTVVVRGAHIEASTKKVIYLEPNFKAQSGSYFRAYIDPNI